MTDFERYANLGGKQDQCSRMVAGPSDISGNRPLGPENSSPTSDRLSYVKFGMNLDVLAETRNWLQARLTVYPPQCAYQNPVNLSKIIFSALNFFMHIFNMSVTYLPSIKKIH